MKTAKEFIVTKATVNHAKKSATVSIAELKPVGKPEFMPTGSQFLPLCVKYDDTLAAGEREHIMYVFTFLCGKNRTETAKHLDIGVRTLQRKLKLYGVPPACNQFRETRPRSC